MYKITDMDYTIQKKRILQNIHLEIKANNFLAIIGANGSGKSTLLKIINGNITNFKGSVLLDDIPIHSYSEKLLAQKRAFLNQSFYFPYSFKSIEIIEMGLFAYKLSAQKKLKIIDFIVDRLNIKNLKEENYQYLSGGEKQKIQLARIMTQIYASEQKEKYLFLDEPTLNLDIYYQYKILDLIQELKNELKIGICAVLHDINQAYIYANQVAMMKDKTIQYFGNTNEILTQKNIYDIFKVKSDFVYSSALQHNSIVTSL